MAEALSSRPFPFMGMCDLDGVLSRELLLVSDVSVIHKSSIKSFLGTLLWFTFWQKGDNFRGKTKVKLWNNPVDNFGTVVGENPSCYGILPLWAVNGLSIVCWEGIYRA